jgi:dUTP pyrophosphatase
MQREVTAKISLWHPDAKVPEYGTPLSAGFDLAVIEDVHLEPREANVFHTGLIIQAPPNHMLLVTPRSSTFRKWGVSLGNTVGIVDEDFCGPDDKMRLYLYNPRADYPVDIPAGTRLAQGIFVPITRAYFKVIEGAIATSRGGWGSTGD